MAIPLATAFVDITTRDDKLKRGLGAGLGSIRSFVSSAVRLAAPLAAAFGAGAAVKGSIDAFREQEKAVAKLGAVLKATGGAAGLTSAEIEAFAAQRQGVTNFGDEVTLAAGAVLATFKEIKGDTFKQALVSMQDVSTLMGTDLKSSAVQLGRALNDPVAGITALTRVGVSFSEQQKQQIKSLQESGDLMGAQTLILKELQSRFGGQAEAAAEPMKQLKNTIGDVGEKIGSALAPALDVAATALTGMLGNVNANGEAFRRFGENAALAVDNLPLAFEKAGSR
jgi:hypothetical protein